MAGEVKGAILALHAQTGVHAGAGTALGVIDLPIQRERHTQWPTVAGSALKGILRDAVRERLPGFADDGEAVAEKERKTRRQKADAADELTTVFGPPTADADKHAGALSVTDARLLAFPVRSLKGVWAWATCAGVLDRFRRDCALANMAVPWTVPQVAANTAAVPTGCPCRVDGALVLEEYDFTAMESPAVGLIANDLAERLLPKREEESKGPSPKREEAKDPFTETRNRFKAQLVVLHDDDFTHFARHATEVVARVGLDYQTKTVKTGALFYQEFLPAETLLYAVVLANPGRTGRATKSAAEVLGTLKKHLPEVLQVGGDETTGKGYCATRLTEGGRNENA